MRSGDRQLENPLVSVCMPAYNSAGYIDAAIQSVINQTYDNIELVITDDGSTDGTGAILAKYSHHPKVTIVNSDRKGPSGACNRAYRQSRGVFIKFFDSDDILNPENIAVQVEKLLLNPHCIAAGQCKRFYNNDITGALSEPMATWCDLTPLDWLLIDNGKGLGMMQNGMFLIPRQLLELSGLWDENISLINDFEFYPRVFLKADRILFTEEAKVFYRSGLGNSVSSIVSRDRLSSAFKALELTTSILLAREDSLRTRSVLYFFWDLFSRSFYLDEMGLYKKARLRMKDLGNFKNSYSSTSPLIKLIGWKNEKKIKRLLTGLKRALKK